VREWLSFSPEHAHPRKVALVAGVASNLEDRKLTPLLRPLRPGNSPAGHFHAAVFSYRPLKKGDLDLNATVRMLFEGENLQTVMHLLSDDRDSSRVNESEFVRGACWFSPLRTVEQ
jgi:hypothetical protein